MAYYKSEKKLAKLTLIMYSIPYNQNITSIYNNTKNILHPFFGTKSKKSVHILHSQHISIKTTVISH